MSESNWVEEIGAPAYSAIVEMVSALECDYGRLEELRGAGWRSDAEIEELRKLQSAAGECTSREDAETRIHEDALEIAARSDWHAPGEDTDNACEFYILVATGGPAVRIRGEISDGEPDRAWLEVQDWGKPWTQYFKADQDTLLTYARCFYFGEG